MFTRLNESSLSGSHSINLVLRLMALTEFDSLDIMKHVAIIITYFNPIFFKPGFIALPLYFLGFIVIFNKVNIINILSKLILTFVICIFS